MLNRLLPLCLFLAASCVAVATSTPIALVDLEIHGEPVILPGGPDVWVDDVYRGNPVGSRFKLWLEAGEHELRLMSGSELLWSGTIVVDERGGTQQVLVRYELDGTGSATTIGQDHLDGGE